MARLFCVGVLFLLVFPVFGLEVDNLAFCESEMHSLYERYGASFKDELREVSPENRAGYAVSEIEHVEMRTEQFDNVCIFRLMVDRGGFPSEYKEVVRFMSSVRVALFIFRDEDEAGSARFVGEYCAWVSRGLKRGPVCLD